jgi:hypothetical protein
MPDHIELRQFDRVPVSDPHTLSTLDDAEMVEGYKDGFAGFPCGDNRSRSYWHGWRNGMVDSGRAKTDAAQMLLAHAMYGKDSRR